MAGMTITGQILELASKRNNFAIPPEGLIFFGIRGAISQADHDPRFQGEHALDFAAVNYRDMRCTLGQWNRADNQIAVFQGSTVPSAVSIFSARAKGGKGANRLIPGRYLYEKGIHKPDKPSGHRAFRQAIFFPVQRTANDLAYDSNDPIDFGTGAGSFVWDNLHSAYSDALDRYSSAGCQVIRGQPRSASRGEQPETGHWRMFIDTAYNRFSEQRTFNYLLFTAEEIGTLITADTAMVSQVIRYGSSGKLAQDVQNALKAEGFQIVDSEGNFGRSSLQALVDYQARKFGKGGSDGVCGPNTFAALGLKPPSVRSGKLKLEPAGTALPSDGTTSDIPDEADLPAAEQEKWRRILNDWLSGFRTGGVHLTPTPQPATVQTDEDLAVPGNPGSIDKDSRAAEDESLRKFERCQEIVREFEGGFVDHPDDPGGATNFGITRKTLAAWQKVADVSVADVKNLSYFEAKEIYRAGYWDQNKCGDMPGPIALIVYNTGVHCGTRTAASYLQRALNKKGAGLEVDGSIGNNTLSALRLAPLEEVASNLIDLYEERLMGHPKIAVFRKGFESRVRKLRREAAAWLAELRKGPGIVPIATPAWKTASPTQSGDPIMSKNLETVLQSLLAELNAALAEMPAGDGKPPAAGSGKTPLGPVNGALGDAIGDALNGKKSAIGIIGALLTSLLGNSMPNTITGEIGTVLTKWMPIFAGSSGTFMPIFLAIFAWGVLGKMEKWYEGKAQ